MFLLFKLYSCLVLIKNYCTEDICHIQCLEKRRRVSSVAEYPCAAAVAVGGKDNVWLGK